MLDRVVIRPFREDNAVPRITRLLHAAYAPDFIPCSAESDALSKALHKAGFNFDGSTLYTFVQVVGRVNDHAANCFRKYAIA